MNVVGIDGGMVRLGLGAVKYDKGSVDLLTYGLIGNPRGEEKFNDFLTGGITQIVNDFPRFLDATRPGLIVSETIPAGKLGSSDSQVIAAVTACHVIAIQWGIRWVNLGANTIKKNLTGDHRASKTLVRNTILDMFPTVAVKHAELKSQQKAAGEKKRTGLPQDVFDALAVAVVGARIVGENDEKKALHELQST